MASKFRLDVTVQENANGAISQIQPAKKSPAMILNKIGTYFTGLAMGRVGSSVRVVMTAVAATGNVALSSIAAGDTITVGATVFTGSDTPTTDLEFLTGTTDAASAASLVAKINAQADTSKYVLATNPSGANVALASLVPGVIGNAIILARSAHATVTAFSGGSEDTPVTLPHGS